MVRGIIILVLAVFSFYSQAKQVDESVKDYLVYANVYQWYGELDASKNGSKNHPKAVIDFAEYPKSHWQAGAHQVLSIDELPAESDATFQVRVTLEFYTKPQNNEAVIGRYLEQVLTFDKQHQQLLSAVTELNEVDDFESNYIASSDTNLIRSMLYRWIQGLDEPTSGDLSRWLATDANVEFAEANIKTIAAYQTQLSELGLIESRRVMRNLQIIPIASNQYQIEFEYQWSALNAQGENEIANIGVSILLTVKDAKVLMQQYKEQYLAPKTDLGAEIKC